MEEMVLIVGYWYSWWAIMLVTNGSKTKHYHLLVLKKHQ